MNHAGSSFEDGNLGTTCILDKDVLTTGDVARLCHVAPRTVTKWVDTGVLRGYRIPGSRDRRVPLANLLAFMQAYGIPVMGLKGGPIRVLLLTLDGQPAWTADLEDSDRIDLRVAGTVFEAGVLAQRFWPQVVVLDIAEGVEEEAAVICRNIRATRELARTQVLAIAPGGSRRTHRWFASRGFDACLLKPLGTEELVAALQRVLDLAG